MFKYATFICLTIGLCAGATCTITFPGDGNGGPGSYVPLDQADAIITITQTAAGAQAEVAARITDAFGFTVLLQDGQAVEVNTQALTGPGGDGYYRQTVPVANNYTITVNEPTRGVQDTTIASAAGFEIASPAAGATASLSGFTVTWSHADANLTVEVSLTQTLFGEVQTNDLGPFADTGTLTLTDDDLIDFAQGADLHITVTRSIEQTGIAGFNSGTIIVQHAETIAVVPGP
ncbi:MAG: hypothetical protein ABIG44_16495 [Planctomycetota bacterium]